MRQCNGVRLTTDRIYSEERLLTVQASKFDFIGDFSYLVFASRSDVNLTANGGRY